MLARGFLGVEEVWVGERVLGRGLPFFLIWVGCVIVVF